jgi:cation transporter-like permease
MGFVLESDSSAMEVSMMGNKSVAVGLIVVGIVVLLASALADVIGLGGQPLVFGYKQVAGSAVGAVLTVVGVVLYWRAGRRA